MPSKTTLHRPCRARKVASLFGEKYYCSPMELVAAAAAAANWKGMIGWFVSWMRSFWDTCWLWLQWTSQWQRRGNKRHVSIGYVHLGAWQEFGIDGVHPPFSLCVCVCERERESQGRALLVINWGQFISLDTVRWDKMHVFTLILNLEIFSSQCIWKVPICNVTQISACAVTYLKEWDRSYLVTC